VIAYFTQKNKTERVFNMNTCDICSSNCGDSFSLCDNCSADVLEWLEDTDTYVMKDGRRIQFREGLYLPVK
jgi:hypothetical protein